MRSGFKDSQPPLPNQYFNNCRFVKQNNVTAAFNSYHLYGIPVLSFSLCSCEKETTLKKSHPVMLFIYEYHRTPTLENRRVCPEDDICGRRRKVGHK